MKSLAQGQYKKLFDDTSYRLHVLLLSIALSIRCSSIETHLDPTSHKTVWAHQTLVNSPIFDLAPYIFHIISW